MNRSSPGLPCPRLFPLGLKTRTQYAVWASANTGILRPPPVTNLLGFPSVLMWPTRKSRTRSCPRALASLIWTSCFSARFAPPQNIVVCLIQIGTIYMEWKLSMQYLSTAWAGRFPALTMQWQVSAFCFFFLEPSGSDFNFSKVHEAVTACVAI